MTTTRWTGPHPEPNPTRPTPSTVARIVGWFAPVLPDRRLAYLRTACYLFVVLDIHTLVRDPIALSHDTTLYRPLLLAEMFRLPAPSAPLVWTLYVVLVVGSLIAAANRLPRAAGFVVAAAFTWWTAIGFSYGKVDHDHTAFVIALWTLPTAGVIAGRWRASTASAQSGWVLKCIQIAVIATYFLSATTKIRNGGGPGHQWEFATWANSFILVWAIVRRPHGLGQFLLPYPELLRGMQWFAFLAELTSVVVLWLRGRALLVAAVFWMGFHAFTVTILYIHFAPTLVCWLAFAPLERCSPWLRRVRGRRQQRVGGRASDPTSG
ncbi:MAG: hypothetical protein ACR2LI_05380 [Propionibacteriaceae bacterium]